jgi:hypothetical protein
VGSNYLDVPIIKKIKPRIPPIARILFVLIRVIRGLK